MIKTLIPNITVFEIMSFKTVIKVKCGQKSRGRQKEKCGMISVVQEV
jgi:hypothetical protein